MYGRHYCKEVEISECCIPANAQQEIYKYCTAILFPLSNKCRLLSLENDESMWRLILHVLRAYGTGYAVTEDQEIQF
jgi:hypothetical protein